MDPGNPGLDMKHGFIHHIRRNQMKRDEYDKEVKARTDTGGGAGSKRRNQKPESPKYPDQEVYRPKTSDKRSSNNTQGAMQPRRGPGKLLYNLEYHDNDGFVHKVSVHKNDDPKVLAKRLALAANIPNELMETLEWKIEQDTVKRDTAVN